MMNEDGDDARKKMLQSLKNIIGICSGDGDIETVKTQLVNALTNLDVEESATIQRL